MKVWWFDIGNCTYFAHFQVLIAKNKDIEIHYFAYFQVITAKKVDIENCYHRAINIAVNGEYLPWSFQVIITDKL